MRREAQHAIRELRESEALKLKLRIYQEKVVSVVNKVIDAEVALSSFIRRFETDIRTHANLTRQGIAGTPPVAGVPKLIDLHTTFDMAAIESCIRGNPAGCGSPP